MNTKELAEKISKKVIDLFLTDLEYYPNVDVEIKWLIYDKNSTIEITCEPYIFESALKKAVKEIPDEIFKETLYLTEKTNIQEIMEVMNIETQSREKAGKMDEEDHRKSDSDSQSGSQESCQLQPTEHVIRNFYPCPARSHWNPYLDPNLSGRITPQYPDYFRPFIGTGCCRGLWS